MDVSGISGFASAVSAQKTADVQSEAQVSLIKKQADQGAAVTQSIIDSAGSATPKPNQGKLLSIA